MTNTAEQYDGTPIGVVEAPDVMAVWDKVEPILQRVVRPDTGHTLDSVRIALLMGHMQLWVIGDFQGVVVTQIENRPSENVLFVQFMAGDDMKVWLDDWIEVMEQFARYNNCTVVEFSGRKGWCKIAERQGEHYKPIRTTFRREL